MGSMAGLLGGNQGWNDRGPSPYGRTPSYPLSDNGQGRMVVAVNKRAPLAVGALVVGLVLTGCGSGSSGHTASPTSSPSATTSPPSSTATTAAVTTGAATCPTQAQADAALGVSYSGPIRTPTPGGGIVCEYTGGPGGNAGVTIFAHQSAAVFAGQVAHAPGVPAMSSISGVGDGAFGSTIGGRSIINAYANAIRTFVAGQAPGPLPPVEALARVALADN